LQGCRRIASQARGSVLAKLIVGAWLDIFIHPQAGIGREAKLGEPKYLFFEGVEQ